MSIDQKIQLTVAIGTIAVAILAIWGDQVRHLLGLGPRLRLSLDDPQGESISISEGEGRSTPSRYYHLRVHNSHRWTQATNVRVVIIGLARPAADGSLLSQPLSGPLQLVWRFSSFHPTYSVVGPDDICDLGFIKQGRNFALTPFVYPNNFAGSLAPNERMLVMLRAVADNAESTPVCVEVSWDGEWADGSLEMASHLVVKQVNCPHAI